MRFACSVLIALMGAAGCADDNVYTLAADVGSPQQGFALNTREVIDDIAVNSDDADFILIAAMEISLADGSLDGAFCAKGSAFSVAAEIPRDASDCAWTNARLGANTSPISRYPGTGFLVRDRTRTSIYRLLVLDHASDDNGRILLTFELED